jgi:hypothetical protein
MTGSQKVASLAISIAYLCIECFLLWGVVYAAIFCFGDSAGPVGFFETILTTAQRCGYGVVIPPGIFAIAIVLLLSSLFVRNYRYAWWLQRTGIYGPWLLLLVVASARTFL